MAAVLRQYGYLADQKREVAKVRLALAKASKKRAKTQGEATSPDPDTGMQEEERKMPERVTAHTSVIDTSTVRSRHYLVMAWNINGIGSVLKSGALRHLLKTLLPTILCLGELKQRADKLLRWQALIPLMREFGYNSYHFHTCDRENTGYSGTAILSRVAPEAFLEGWADKPKVPDDEGRVLADIFPRLVVIHTYSPSTGFDKPDREKFRRKHDKRL